MIQIEKNAELNNCYRIFVIIVVQLIILSESRADPGAGGDPPLIVPLLPFKKNPLLPLKRLYIYIYTIYQQINISEYRALEVISTSRNTATPPAVEPFWMHS